MKNFHRCNTVLLKLTTYMDSIMEPLAATVQTYLMHTYTQNIPTISPRTLGLMAPMETVDIKV